MKTVTLYRPVGPEELELVKLSGYSKWPPRLPGQPIFYPVLNEAYATQIARDWNVKDSGVGYVTKFDVDEAYISNFDVQQVGGKMHLEYWIPDGSLAEFNTHIIGTIEVISKFTKE